LEHFKSPSIHEYFAVIYTKNNVIRLVHVCIIATAINSPLFCFADTAPSNLHICINLPYAEGKLIHLGDAFSELILKKEPYINILIG